MYVCTYINIKKWKKKRKKMFVDCCQLSGCKNKGNSSGQWKQRRGNRQVRMLRSFMFLFGLIELLCACGRGRKNLCADRSKKSKKIGCMFTLEKKKIERYKNEVKGRQESVGAGRYTWKWIEHELTYQLYLMLRLVKIMIMIFPVYHSVLKKK